MVKKLKSVNEENKKRVVLFVVGFLYCIFSTSVIASFSLYLCTLIVHSPLAILLSKCVSSIIFSSLFTPFGFLHIFAYFFSHILTSQLYNTKPEKIYAFKRLENRKPRARMRVFCLCQSSSRWIHEDFFQTSSLFWTFLVVGTLTIKMKRQKQTVLSLTLFWTI